MRTAVPLTQNPLAPGLFAEARPNAETRIRAVGFPQRELLLRMYDRFDPKGAALGLPPHMPETRRAWVETALGHRTNVAAFSPAGEIVGHSFLAIGKPGHAELAVFVHQDSRRKGVGSALVKSVLESARAAALRRVWGVIASDNRAALRLLESCGFRLTTSQVHEIELQIDLP
jgi:GNAT superfamily N-acetyltransferase